MSKLPSDLDHWLRWVEHENPEPEPAKAAEKASELLSDLSYEALYAAALLVCERNGHADGESKTEDLEFAIREFPSALIALTRALYAPYAEMCSFVPECVETDLGPAVAIDSALAATETELPWWQRNVDTQALAGHSANMQLVAGRRSGKTERLRQMQDMFMNGNVALYDPGSVIVGVDTPQGSWARSANGDWVKVG